MIHPSMMTGPNWLTGSFGQTHPFQQSVLPFPGQPFGIHPLQVQQTAQEITRQVLPTVLASVGIPPAVAFQASIGQPGTFGFPTPFGFPTLTGPVPFGPQFQSILGPTQWQSAIQNPLLVQELIRQTTQQVIQSLAQQNPWLQQVAGIGTPPFGGALPPFGIIGPQIHPQQQLQQQLQLQLQQQVASVVEPVCRAVTASVIASLTQPSQMQNLPLNLQSILFTTPNLTSRFGVTPGIPAGVGAF